MENESYQLVFQLACEIEQQIEEIKQTAKTYADPSEIRPWIDMLESLKLQLIVNPGDSVWPHLVTSDAKLKESLYQSTVSAEQHAWSVPNAGNKLKASIREAKECKEEAEARTYALALKAMAAAWTARQWTRITDAQKLRWLTEVQRQERIPDHLLRRVMKLIWA